MTEYTTFADAIIAAHAESRRTGQPAYAVQWANSRCTVQPNKPMLRTADMRVVECDNGRELLA